MSDSSPPVRTLLAKGMQPSHTMTEWLTLACPSSGCVCRESTELPVPGQEPWWGVQTELGSLKLEPRGTAWRPWDSDRPPELLVVSLPSFLGFGLSSWAHSSGPTPLPLGGLTAGLLNFNENLFSFYLWLEEIQMFALLAHCLFPPHVLHPPVVSLWITGPWSTKSLRSCSPSLRQACIHQTCSNAASLQLRASPVHLAFFEIWSYYFLLKPHMTYLKVIQVNI